MPGWFAFVLFWLIAILLHLWSALAVYYCSFPSHSSFRLPAALFYGIVVIAWIIFSRRKVRALALSLAAFVVVAFWFSAIKPPRNAVYPAELTLAFAEISQDKVILHHVRNCKYRTTQDFDLHYETRTYDLNKLKTLDVYVNYWGMDLIAHTFLSFGFSDGQYLAVSVEIRPEIGKAYDMLQGFFKQYNLIYIWADERDLVALRTNYKKENVYLYRSTLSPEKVRKMFLSMIEETNAIHRTPQFYNTLTHSCTNTLGNHLIAEKIVELPIWKRKFLTGDVDQRMYREGLLNTSLPFPELRKRANIDARAQQAGQGSDFSKKIRTQR